MSFLSRLLGRSARQSPSDLSGADTIDLVQGPRPRFKAPRRLNIDASLQLRPWSMGRLMAIFREANRFPSEATFRDARYARHCLSRFWLAAPIDLLEELYNGALGELQRELLAGPLPHQDLASEENAWRQEISSLLSENFNRPERWNLFLAAMPYYAPGRMKLDHPEQQLPEWLLADYATYCDPDLELQVRPRAALAGASPAASPAAAPSLWHQRGAELIAIFEEEAFHTRHQGLLNLYAIDPSDSEVIAELARLRRQLGQLWLDVAPEQLEDLYRTPVGELYRNLVASGFGAAPLSSDDHSLRQALVPLVEDLERPGAAQILLALVPFFPPGKVHLEDTSALPPWLQQELRQLSA